MAHTYANLLVHCVFGTKERRKSIAPKVQPSLWAYIGGIARMNGFKALTVGGTDDHCHALLSLPPRISVAKAMQLVKAGSSKWMREQHSRFFTWQECYGAFTVGESQLSATIEYI
jgi:REP-associated tyrosine transposase